MIVEITEWIPTTLCRNGRISSSLATTRNSKKAIELAKEALKSYKGPSPAPQVSGRQE